MLIELNVTPTLEADLDEQGRTSYVWLLRRVCAVGPDNIHESIVDDIVVAEYSDSSERLNLKRYQA